MAKIISPLTETQIENAPTTSKQGRLYDGGGLYLMTAPTGTNLWRFKYRFEGKEKLISFGAYPDVSLSDARKLRNDSRQLLAIGYDPSAVRRDEREKEKAVEASVNGVPSVRVLMGGGVEIWKGRVVMRLTDGEAQFVSDLLIKLR